MSISALGSTAGPSSQAKRAVAAEVLSDADLLLSLDRAFAARAAEFDAGALYAFEGEPLVDAAGAARLDAAMAVRLVTALGVAAEGPLAADRLAARAAERFGGASVTLAGGAGTTAETGLAWVAATGFGPARANECAALRTAFAGVLLADMASLAETGLPADAGAAATVALAALSQPMDGETAPEAASVMAAIAEARPLADARNAMIASIRAERGVMNKAERERRVLGALTVAPWVNSTAKRVFDIVVSLAMLLALSPLLIGVLIMMMFEKGPVFFAHERIGRGGRLFPCLKFRTMIPNAQQKLDAVLAADPELAKEWAETQKLKNDPRITKLGWFLRKTSVDELPQLLNVLRGEMTLVGARPIIEEEADRWGVHFAAYKLAKPGLTGPWQIFFRSTSDYQSRFDMLEQYYERAGLMFDLRMVAMTALTPFDTGKAA